jgi:iron complex transport system ATP-binding protein
LLRADNVSFAYRDAEVLRQVSVDIRPGELVGILGPNGSGKTTLVRLLAGLLVPAHGAVTLDGRALASIPRAAIARRIAMVPQETHPAFDYAVLEIALMGRYPHLGPFELEGPSDLAIARRALTATGTATLEDRLFSTLSGGEKQRVVIASALAQFDAARDAASADARQILLLDEPTASLDLAYQLEIAGMLERLSQTRGLTIVVCTHDINLAARVCNRLLMLREGRVLASGDTERVLTPETIRALYGVEVEISRPATVGRTVVVPVRRSQPPDGRP